MDEPSESFDLAIIGAGPVGLAAAIAAKRLGLSAVTLEKGIVVNSIFGFPAFIGSAETGQATNKVFVENGHEHE